MTALLKPLPDALIPHATEIEIYYRELPRLLDEGAGGKYFVVKGTEAHGVWDTFRDALQYGHDKFSDGQFMAQKIDRRYLGILAEFFGDHPVIEAEVARCLF